MAEEYFTSTMMGSLVFSSLKYIANNFSMGDGYQDRWALFGHLF